jgi:acetylornithine aminotransferase
LQEIIELDHKYYLNTFGPRVPLCVDHGAGAWLFGTDGRRYLDLIGGIAVNVLGHAHPALVQAICAQAGKVIHCCNYYYNEPQTRLAVRLAGLTGLDRAFIGNSGAEANEAAIKLARKHSRDRYGPGRFHVVTMKRSFHGRTLATLSATGQEKVHKGFEPLVEGFAFAEFNSIPSVEQAITDRTCAVMVEPIQGEGGVNFPDPNYLAYLKALCRKRDLLLIFDEVQVGMGRTGALFAHEHEGVTPDVMTLAKALGNGLPIGAMLATDEAAASFVPGTHASTFGGTPLVTSAALRVLQLISDPAFLDGVRRKGAYFMERLGELKSRHAVIKDVRGRGLMIGMELQGPGQRIVERCLEEGFIINCTHDTVLRFVPPLIVAEEEIDRLIQALEGILSEDIQ